jgi:hypothetical protein
MFDLKGATEWVGITYEEGHIYSQELDDGFTQVVYES